jgi:hypothetical protein
MSLSKQPFNQEMRELAQEFANLLRPMIESVDRFGLKAHYLRKHKCSVNRFYDALSESVEFDREKLPERVAAAETSIYKRLQAISQSVDHRAEYQPIEDALGALRVLKRDSLGFPDWEKK